LLLLLLAQDGGSSSSTRAREDTSGTSMTVELLMSQEAKILKDK
jgi:hypothetical protein